MRASQWAVVLLHCCLALSETFDRRAAHNVLIQDGDVRERLIFILSHPAINADSFVGFLLSAGEERNVLE